jgi:uncharacterized membrane protein YcaP (DUF421 family)
MWANVFHLAMPFAEKILRSVLVYFALVVLLRVFGKRELAQLNPFDLVVLLSLSNTVQNAFIGNDNSVTGGLLGAVSLLVTNYLVVRFIFRHRRLDQLIEGTPTVLIEGGRLRRDALAKELLTESELATVAHRQGFKNLDHIERCVLEPGGTFFIEGKESAHDTAAERGAHDKPADSSDSSSLMKRIDSIAAQLEELRRELQARA